MSMIRECILNEIRMKLVEFDHNGIPTDVPGDTPREQWIAVAALTVAALEEIDTKMLAERL